ncbi:hypothetical protein B0H17DRAFT_1132790 [Mycena rosella]|uniref:Uncharacterized protein n=1 Tax=Mycena rosella TaxID=1033263 RepID=A0AAD7GL89_MYCRO|nr:hypothetical protein B0H17DRAFT_1132790 [Mycena rosella]
MFQVAIASKRKRDRTVGITADIPLEPAAISTRLILWANYLQPICDDYRLHTYTIPGAFYISHIAHNTSLALTVRPIDRVTTTQPSRAPSSAGPREGIHYRTSLMSRHTRHPQTRREFTPPPGATIAHGVPMRRFTCRKSVAMHFLWSRICKNIGAGSSVRRSVVYLLGT